MNQFVWNIIRQSDVTDSDLEKIAALKDEHWPHGLNSQKTWINENLKSNDIHLIARAPDGRYLAYLSLVNVIVKIDGCQKNMIGLGNVCVDKGVQHSGYGLALVAKANEYIIDRESIGILLCKEELVPFYEKCGWAKKTYKRARVAGNEYTHNVMINPDVKSDIEYLEIMRNF